MAGLEIQIGADTSELEKGIKDAEKKLKDLANTKLEQIKLGINTKDVNKDIRVVKQELSILKTSLKDSGDSFNKLTPKVANGGNALMQFSRIAQDAPFGIMGIGNNITATAESFGHLVKETGSAGGALKSVASSMLGTGGILLAVSLVTSGLTYMSQNGIKVGDVFAKLTGDFDGYASALKKVNDAAYEDKGVKDAIQNVNELTINIDLAKRGFLNKAQVVKQYNETIGKTTGLVASLDEAERELTKNGDAYIRMTLYKAAANLALEEAAKATLAAEKSRQKSLKEFTNSFLDADLTQTRSKEQYEAKQQNLKRQAENRQKEEVKINADAAKKNIDIAKKFQQDAANIAKNFNFNLFGDTTPEKKAKTKKEPKVKKDTFDAQKRIDELKEIAFQMEEVTSVSLFEDDGKTIANLDKLKEIALQMSQLMDSETYKAKQDLIKFNEQLSSIITNGTVSALSGIGEAIGDALVNGGNIIDSIGKTILGSMGSMLKDLGKATIAYGVGLIAVKAAIKNPYLAVAAGVAMVALGSAMSSAVSKSSSSALGGSSSGGMSSGASYSSPASSSSYSSGGGGMGGGTVVFEISGTSLIGVLNNTLDRNKRLGGS